MGAKTMKEISERYSSLKISLVGLLFFGTLAFPSSAQGGLPQLEAPSGFTYADADLDRAGTGFVLWKNTDGLTSKLQRVRAFEVTSSWDLPGFLGKGLRLGEDGPVLLMGVSPEGADLRLVAPHGDELEELWTSSAVSAANRLDEEQLSVSTDLRWWYGARFLDDGTEVLAGLLGATEPSFQWEVPTEEPDAFLSVLVDVESDPDSLRLALAVDGAGWLLSSETSSFEPVVLPEACPALVSLSSGRDGLWAHCESGVHALYPTSLPMTQGTVEPTAILATGDLRVLTDGTAVTVERRHDAPGTLQVVERKPDGRLRLSDPSIPYPVPLGRAGHIAGSQLLLPLEAGPGTDRTTHESYRVVPLALPDAGRG